MQILIANHHDRSLDALLLYLGIHAAAVDVMQSLEGVEGIEVEAELLA